MLRDAVYHSGEGHRAVEAVYREAVERLSVDLEERWVATRHGRTHVLLAGPPEGPPLLMFYGGIPTNSMTLAWYAALAVDYAPSRIETILDGCALMEHWVSASEGEGMSLF